MQEKPFPSDAIGIHFLARHLVTLDFPGRTLYLKRITPDPFADEGFGGAVNFLKGLKKKGRLPGWSKDDNDKPSGVKINYTANSATVEAQKIDDSSIYHYIVIRASEKRPWKLQKAWRTDQTGRNLEKYPIP